MIYIIFVCKDNKLTLLMQDFYNKSYVNKEKRGREYYYPPPLVTNI